MEPFTGDLFYGAECFFLLDMGIVAAQRIARLNKTGAFLIMFSIFMPIVNAILGSFVARFLNLDPGNALLFVVLCASASYLSCTYCYEDDCSRSYDLVITFQPLLD